MRRGKLPDALFANGLPAGTTEDLEEERRLLYVAMTRAKDNLHLIVPQRFYVGGQRVSAHHREYEAAAKNSSPIKMR
jgi:DNA helicase II / ATP-dependent DNA helicase PcrA